MKRLYKDVLLLFIYNISNAIYSQWPLIYPYLISYVLKYNPSINMQQGFFTTLFLFMGIPVGSWLLPNLYFFLGIKYTMITGGVLFFINCLLYIPFTSLFFISLNALFSGVVYQIGVTSSSYYLSEKYSDGFIYSSYSYIGQNVANFIWPFLCVWFINPNNLDMVYNTEKQESYFPWEIAARFPLLMIIIGFVSFLFALVPCLYIHDPAHVKMNLIPYFQAWWRGDQQKLKELSKEFSIKSEKSSILSSIHQFSIINSIHSQNIIQSIKSNEEKLLNDYDINLTDEEAEAKANKILYSMSMIFFTIFLAIRTGPLMYLVDNYKLISFNLLKNDELISLALSVSSLVSILGQIFIIPVWNYLGFYFTQIFLSIMTLLVFVIYLMYAVNSSFFMFWILTLNRITSKMVYGSIYFSKFGLFHPKIAIYISKVVDLSYFFSMVFAVSLNFIFFSENDISTIFKVFFLFNFVCLILFILYYKSFEKKAKEL